MPASSSPREMGVSCRAGAAEHRHRRVAPVLGGEGSAFVKQAPGQGRGLLPAGGVAGQFHLPVSGERAGFERGHRDACRRGGVQLCGDCVGRGQHVDRIAPRGAQVGHRCRAQPPGPGGVPGGARRVGGTTGPGNERRELGREAEELPGRGAAEPVDGLVGVAHRRQRVPVAEDAGKEHHLGVGGVLELVEQHDLELRAFGLCGLGDLAGNAGGQCHQVPVVQGAAGSLGPRVVHRQFGDGGTGAQLVQQLACLQRRRGLLVGPVRQRLEPAHQRIDPFLGVHRVHQVLGAFPGEGHHGVDERVLRRGQVLVVTGIALDHRGGNLPRMGGAQQRGVGLDADAQPVFLHQGVGVGVVGGHRGIKQSLVVQLEQPGACQFLQLPADALGQFPGGLAGEGHAQDFLGAHLSVGHQPDHPVRHGGGLARSGAGDDQQRFQRGGDDRRLFGRGLVLAQDICQFLG